MKKLLLLLMFPVLGFSQFNHDSGEISNDNATVPQSLLVPGDIAQTLSGYLISKIKATNMLGKTVTDMSDLSASQYSVDASFLPKGYTLAKSPHMANKGP